jgi:hypothetical protein
MRFKVSLIIAIAAISLAYAALVRVHYLDMLEVSTPSRPDGLLPIKPRTNTDELIHFTAAHALPPYCLAYVCLTGMWLIGYLQGQRDGISHAEPDKPVPE